MGRRKNHEGLCVVCFGKNPRRITYHHESGDRLCYQHLRERALGSRKDFRSKEELKPVPEQVPMSKSRLFDNEQNWLEAEPWRTW